MTVAEQPRSVSPWATSSSPRYLSDFDGSRQNNLTSIRILLAWSVLYGHSFAIARIPGVNDPLNQLFLGSIWIGELAVNGFFALSGFLVTASFVRRGMVDYSLSRGLRIFPALAVCVLLSVFVMGAAVTSLPLGEYLEAQDTRDYLWNALAFFRMEWYLPGVFEQNTSNSAVNGSLWTLTVEVRCYALLAIAGLFGVFRYRTTANLAIVAVFVFGYFHFADIPFVGMKEKWSRPCYYFLLGVFVYTNRDKVVLDGRLAVLAVVLCYVAFGKAWFPWVFTGSFVYLLFFIAYATPFINTDGRVGDMSYGIYIYAWPVQQLVFLAIPGIHPHVHIVVSTLAVLPLAYVSWHYLERPALGLKSRLIRSGSQP